MSDADTRVHAGGPHDEQLLRLFPEPGERVPAALDLAPAGEGDPFDGAVLAGNVMVFLAPGTEADALRSMLRSVVTSGSGVGSSGTSAVACSICSQNQRRARIARM